MADVNANIGVNIDTSEALAQLKSLQRQISQFHTSVAKSSEAAALAQRDLQRNFINSVNALGAFSAELRTVRTTSESFTDSLEKNKFSMREYFRYAGGATKTFGRLFKSEFDTIGKVAEDRVKKLQTQYIKLGRDTSGAMKAIAIIPNELDLKNYSTQTQLAAQKQAIFNQLVKQGSTNLLNFGKNTQWAGRQLMVGFTLPLASLGVTAARTFMDMETAALKFRKVYGDLFTPASETQAALDSITALGEEFTKYGIAVSQTVGLAAEAAAAGFSGLDLQRQTTEATRLSVLGQVEQQKALETTISLQNAFKMSSIDLASSIDFLNAVENQTVVSLDDITTAIPKVAPVIQQLGGDVKDLAFFLAALKEGGVNASEGANALKSGLGALINPTEKASAMLGSMGINIKSIIEANKGDLKATVIAFASALDTLDPLNRARAIEQLFGKFQFARLSTLFDNVINQTGQASRVLDLAGTSVEDLAALSEKELGMTADSAMNQFRKSVEDLKVALVPVGETFLKAVTPIVEFIGGILEKFNGLSDGVKKAIVVLTVAIGAIGPVALMTFGLLANGLANIVKGALILRQGYLRLTGQSQILGEQTDYLTTEQMNATAVAHSLDQSHARLIQTFTAEAGALSNLIGVYEAANRSAANFAINNPGMMMPPKPRKFAKGGEVFAVPGSGNGDTVPAMLTPGEIVVPKRQSKKYLPLIQGIIADNIPGYKKSNLETTGTVLGGKFVQRQFSKIAMMGIGNTAGGYGMDPEWLAMSEEAKAGFASALRTAGLAEAGIKQTADNYNNFWKGLNPVLDEIFNIFKSGMGENIKNVAQLGEQQYPLMVDHINKLEQSMQLSATDAEQLRVALRQLVAPLESDLTQKDIKRIELAIDEAGQTVVKRASYERSGQTLKEAAVRNFPRELALRGMQTPENIGEYSFAHIPQGREALTYVDPYLRKKAGAGSPAEQKVLEDLRKGITFKEGQVIADAAIQGAIEGAATKSPSKKTIPVGEDIARGLQVGMQNQIDETQRVARSLGGTATEIINPKTGRPFTQQERSALGVGGNVPQIPISNIQEQTVINEELKKSANKHKDAINASSAAIGKLNSRLMGATFAVGSVSGALSMFGADLGGLTPLLFKVNSGLFALATTLQLLTGSKFLGLIIGRFGKFAQVLQKTKVGQAVAKTGAAQKVGGVASRALGTGAARAGVVAAAGGITAATGGTALIVIAALAALIASIYMLNKSYKKQIYELERFGKAAFISTGELEKLSEALGVNLAKTGYQAPTVFGRAPEEQEKASKFEEDIKNSEELMDRVETLKKATGGQAAAILLSFGIQMTSAGMSPADAQILIETLAKMSEKKDILIKASIDLNTVKFKEQLEEGTNAFESAFKFAIDELNKSTKFSDITKNIELVGGVASAAFSAVSTEVNRGTLSLEKADIAFKNITKEIKKVGKARELTVLKNTLANVSPEAAEVTRQIKNSASALALLKAGAVGVELDPFIAQIREAGEVTDKLRDSLDTVFKGQLRVLDLTRKVSEARAKLTEMEANAIKQPASAALTEEEKLQKQLDALKRMQTKLKVSAILEVAKPAQENFKQNVDQIISDINTELSAVDVDLQINPDAINNIFDIEKELKRIDMDMAEAVTPEYRAAQFQIDDLNQSIDQYNRKNDVANRQLSVLEERYQKQADALQEVSDLQAYLSNQQKKQITLADALSQGDISAAAAAAEEMRAEAAQFRLDQEKKSLENSPDILALREQIKLNDEEIYKINEQIYEIQQDSLKPVDDALQKLEREKILLGDMKTDYDSLVAYQTESLRIKKMSNQEIEQEMELLQLQIELLSTTAAEAGDQAGKYTQAQIEAQRKLLIELEDALKAAQAQLSAEMPEEAGPMGWWKRQWERFKNFLLEDIPAFFGRLPSLIAEAAGNIWGGIKTFGTWIKESWDAIVQWFIDLPANIVKLSGVIWRGLKTFGEWVSEGWNAIVQWFQNLPFLIGQTVGLIWRGLQTLGEWVSEGWNSIVAWFVNLPTLISTTVNGIWSKLQTLSGWFQEKWPEAFEWLAGRPEAIKNSITGSNLWAGLLTLKEWFELRWSNALEWIKSLPTKIGEAIEGKNIWSALWTLKEWFVNRWQNTADWLTKELPAKIGNAAKDMWDKLPSLAGAIAGMVASLPASIFSGIADKARDAWNSVFGSGGGTPSGSTSGSTGGGTPSTGSNTVNPNNLPFGGASVGGTGGSTGGATGGSTGGTTGGATGGSTGGTTGGSKPSGTLTSAPGPSDIGKLSPQVTTPTGGGGAGGRYVAAMVARGGLIEAKYMARGGIAKMGRIKRGTDTVPAMLTPGEFVVSKYAVQNYGVDRLKAINNGETNGDGVYNYSINVNVKSDSNPDDIARAVMTQIKRIDSQRIRGQIA